MFCGSSLEILTEMSSKNETFCFALLYKHTYTYQVSLETGLETTDVLNNNHSI